MAIAEYNDLVTAAANWSHRTDLTSRIPEFIALAEAKINRHLRTLEMVTKNASFSITGEYVATPTNFGGVQTFYLNTSPKQNLEFMPDDSQTGYFGSGSGKPRFYCIQGSNFRFGPVPDGTYSATLVYYLKVPALTSADKNNWLLTAYPDCYLYGVMAELAAHAKDNEETQKWTQALYMVLEEISANSNRTKWGGNSMAVRLG
jgi:hypothetical protein